MIALFQTISCDKYASEKNENRSKYAAKILGKL